MKLKDVLAISGQGGLFKFVAQSRNGIIVESLADGTRTCAPATARVSSLGEIAIFTDGEDMPLAEVFQKIYEKCEGKQTIDPKSPAEALKKYFAEVLPEYDRSYKTKTDLVEIRFCFLSSVHFPVSRAYFSLYSRIRPNRYCPRGSVAVKLCSTSPLNAKFHSRVSCTPASRKAS